MGKTDRAMLASVALDLLASYGADRECDHYRLGEDIVDHFGLDLFSSDLGFHDEEGRTLLKLAQGFTDEESGWNRGEHLAEARAVEAHQEAKHGDA